MEVVCWNLFDSLPDREVYRKEGAKGGDGYSGHVTSSDYGDQKSQYRQVWQRTYEHDDRGNCFVQLISQTNE